MVASCHEIRKDNLQNEFISANRNLCAKFWCSSTSTYTKYYEGINMTNEGI